MSATASPVQKISGGCLCGSVRYDVTFNSWPPESGTCQCTMCRKFTGSLFPQLMPVQNEQVTPPLFSSPAYKEFSSSPGRFRGFCGNCGSPLVWRSAEKPTEFDIFLGSIDEKFLVGERVEGTEKKTPQGITVERRGGLGRDICTPNQVQLFCENAIPGVTDLLHGGKRYLAWDDNGEQPLPESK